MKYSVFCTAAADGELAAIWISSDDRKSVSQAAHDIEQALTTAPFTHGESRAGDLRIIFVAPLGARYLVLPEDQRAVIVQFWTF
ncbi:MAG: hypothetical protein WCQ77_10290 [Planctomycetota bacterium]